ncbi:MAG: LysR family transcriptional regulator, partial [Mesorhizobium sp.]
MQRGDMKDLLWFLAVARERSFTRAAAELGTSQSTLYQSLAPRFEEIEADLAGLVAFRDKPAGTVRITLSDHALQTTVWLKLEPMLCDYPDLRVELYSDNGMRNIVEERFDAGVRLGESVDRD